MYKVSQFIIYLGFTPILKTKHWKVCFVACTFLFPYDGIDFGIFWFYNFPQTEVKSEEGPGWTILRDDFMMGASMKDWDKESDGPDDSRPESASDSDT